MNTGNKNPRASGRAVVNASPTAPSTEASEPVGEREDDDPWLSGDDMMGASS